MKIIAIGKQHDKNLRDAIEAYQRRLKKPYSVEWIFLPHSPMDGAKAAEEESERIAKRISRDDFVIVLDERGEQLTSPDLSELVERVVQQRKQLLFVIGGAYGVTPDLRQRADLVWSLSSLVFPHQLVRLILTEQIYRAQTIARNEPYHHE